LTLQTATIGLTVLTAAATIFGLVLGAREFFKGREDVRFHGRGDDEGAAIAAMANLTRAVGLVVVGVADLLLCALLVQRTVVAPTPAHPYIAVILLIQATGYLTLIVGEWRTRRRIGRMPIPLRNHRNDGDPPR
jgi:hypothetical protein